MCKSTHIMSEMHLFYSILNSFAKNENNIVSEPYNNFTILTQLYVGGPQQCQTLFFLLHSCVYCVVVGT